MALGDYGEKSAAVDEPIFLSSRVTHVCQEIVFFFWANNVIHVA